MSMARDVVTLALIAPIAATAVALPVWGLVAGPYCYVIPIAVGAAALLGAPALSVARKKGWTRLFAWASVGALAGALSPIVMAVMLGVINRVHLATLEWRFFFSFEPLTVLIGALSATTFWLTSVQSKFSRGTALLLACLAFLIGAAVMFLWLWSQGWTPTLHGARRRL